MNEALTYLTERVLKINPRNPKANKGCRLLYPHIDRMQEVMPDLHNLILKAIVQNKGKARLTNLTPQNRTTDFRSPRFRGAFGADLASMGILIIEAYMNELGIIEVLRDPDHPGNPIRADYVVMPTIQMAEQPPLPSQTSRTPIAAVSEPVRPMEGCL